jgi:hypothetical protein
MPQQPAQSASEGGLGPKTRSLPVPVETNLTACSPMVSSMHDSDTSCVVNKGPGVNCLQHRSCVAQRFQATRPDSAARVGAAGSTGVVVDRDGIDVSLRRWGTVCQLDALDSGRARSWRQSGDPLDGASVSTSTLLPKTCSAPKPLRRRHWEVCSWLRTPDQGRAERDRSAPVFRRRSAQRWRAHHRVRCPGT